MSLLLEALKKAELAKQGTQAADNPPAPEPVPFPTVELQIEDSEPPRPPVITRESLPDISMPLEIRSEDIGALHAEAPLVPRPQPSPEIPVRVEPEPARPPSPGPAAMQPLMDEPAPAEQRDAARQMFDVKEVDYNPRRPFYLTVAGLLTAGVCYGVYVWWQMQPHYAAVTPAVTQNAPRPPANPAPVAAAPVASPAEAAGATPVAGVPVAPAAAPAPGPAGTPARRSPQVEPTPAAPGAAPSPQPVFVGAAAAAQARGAAPAPGARSAPPSGASTPIAINPATAMVDPGVERAYAAYQSGSWEAARGEYQRVLERDPSNRDALLGLAAIDVRARSYETAELRYLRLLELNPRDTYAAAALIGLQGNVDPVQSESRIKSMIAGQPEATHLYFTLGNLYASQSRWAEAQDAFFKAYGAEPENPDYAFNLAVALDQLRQRRPAADYYRKAAALATTRPAAFDRARAAARAQELER